MFCPHCGCDSETMPGWQHTQREPDAQGTTEHLWWGIFTKYGFRFGAGVSVKRNPLVDRHYGGAASLTWKLRRMDGGPTVEALCTDVVQGAMTMVGSSENSDFSRMQTWAATLQSHGARTPRKYTPAADEAVPF